LALFGLLAGDVMAVVTGTCLVMGSVLVRWHVEIQRVALHWILWGRGWRATLGASRSLLAYFRSRDTVVSCACYYACVIARYDW